MLRKNVSTLTDDESLKSRRMMSNCSNLTDDDESFCEPSVGKTRDSKAKDILSYLLAIKTGESFGHGDVTFMDDKIKNPRKVEDNESRDESSYGVECILTKNDDEDPPSIPASLFESPSLSNFSIRGIFPSPTVDSQRGIYPTITSDTQRARDCILPLPRHRSRRWMPSLFNSDDASESLCTVPDESSIISRWSKASRVKPIMADSDMISVVSKWSDAASIDALFDVIQDVREDDPWRAAKRGDLEALKKFQAEGDVDWTAEDDYQNTPLYYACLSGAIVDTRVVTFLLEVTPNKPSLIEKCRKNAINKKVVAMLEFPKPNEFKPIDKTPRKTEVRDGAAGTTVSEMESIAGFSLSALFGTKPSEKKRDESRPVLDDIIIRKLQSLEETRDSGRTPKDVEVRPVDPTRRQHPNGHATTTKKPKSSMISRFGVGMSISSKDKKSKKGAQADLPPRHRQPQRGGRAEMHKNHYMNERQGFHGQKSDHRGSTFRSQSQPPNRRKGKKQPPHEPDRKERHRDTTKDDRWRPHHNVNSDRKIEKRYHPRRRHGPPARPQPRSSSLDSRRNTPIIEFQESRSRWMIANQTKRAWTDTDRMVLTIHVFDPKQTVLIANCRDVTIYVNGKIMSGLVVDHCQRVNVVFDTVLSACEVHDSKEVILETKGVCPTFQLDGAHGCTVWLSRESKEASSFVTSKCTDVNVSIPHGDDDTDRVEVPIPEQFVHKLFGEAIESSASYEKAPITRQN